jgi:hypothetical protein
VRLSSFWASSCEQTQSQKKQHKWHAIFIPWFGQVTLAYFHVVASQWTRVALNPFQVIWWSTWIPWSFPVESYPVCKESPQLRASRPYNDDHKRSTEIREGRATHTRLKSTAQPRTQVTTWAQSTTHGVRNTNEAQITNTMKRMRGSGVWML